METCNAVGCFNPRHKSTGGYEYAYCYEHWLQRMEGYKWDDQPERKDEVARPKSDVCVVVGCDQPRMRNKQGEMLTMCDEHQHEYWRKKATEREAKKPPRPRATQPPKLVATVDSTPLPTEAPIETNQQLLVASDTLYEAASKYIERHDCDHCTAKATIEALRAKSPKLAKLIDAMQAEVEAAQELGL